MWLVIGIVIVVLIGLLLLFRPRTDLSKLVESRLSRFADVPVRRCLAIVNPVSGRGSSKQDWLCISSSLCRRGFSCALLTTERRGHIEEFLKSSPKLGEEHDVLAVAGGDGSLFEFVNASRESGVTHPPLVPIPSGTGNGVATSLGIRSTADAAAAIYSGEERAMDLLSVELGGSLSRVAVLSVGWGGIADADFLTERDLRWLGTIRTVAVPLMIIARLRMYPGKVRFKAAPKQGAITKPHSLDGEGQVVLEGQFVMVHLCNLPWIATDMLLVPGADMNDGAIAVCVIRACTRLQLVSMFLKAESGNHVNLDFVEVYWATEVTLEPESTPVGSIAVDGEAMGYPEKVVVKSLPGAMKVQVPPCSHCK